MAAAAYLDNFTNLSGWTAAAGLSVSGGNVVATTGGATGAARLTYGGLNDELTYCVRVVPNKADAAGRFTFVGQDNGSGAGTGVYYKQGVGICVGLISGGAPLDANRTILLADASITSGADYYVHVMMDGQTSDLKTVAAVFDKDGNWLGGGEYGAVVQTWLTMTNLYIASNSALSSISRFAADPNPVGGAVSRPNKVVDLFGRWNVSNNVNHWIDLYVPGHAYGGQNVLAVFCHPAGTWRPNTLMGSQDTLWNRALQAADNMTVALLRAGVTVCMPAGYSETGATQQCWASPDGYADTVAGINWVAQKMQTANGTRPTIILLAPSMGAAMALRLIIGKAIPGIKACILIDGVTSLSQALLDGTFGPQINSAWGAAVSGIANYDAHALLLTQPGLFAGIDYTLFSSTNDVVVNPALYMDVFASRLTSAGINSAIHIQRPYGNHFAPGAKLLPPADAALAVRRALATVGTSEVDLAAIASSIRDMQVDVTATFNMLGDVGSAVNDAVTASQATQTAMDDVSATIEDLALDTSYVAGAGLKMFVDTVNHEQAPVDIIQGAEHVATVLVEADGAFANPTPDSITAVVADDAGNRVAILNSAITRITEHTKWQIFQFTLSSVNTDSLDPGFAHLEVTIDGAKAYTRSMLRILRKL